MTRDTNVRFQGDEVAGWATASGSAADVVAQHGAGPLRAVSGIVRCDRGRVARCSNYVGYLGKSGGVEDGSTRALTQG